jgi:lysophospholipase L1-like esterase
MTPSVITATAASTATPIVAAVSVVNPCVVVVGDSVAHGGMVFEIPATGYVHGTSSPLSQFVDQELKKAGLTDLRGVDRAVSNTGISSRNHYSYFRTASYQNLLTDHCKYTIMLPWVNDITSDWPASYAAPHHVAALVRFVGELADGNPGGRILVLNYYRPVLAPFALQTWARGFIPENIDAYNHEIELSCQYGTFSKLPQVVCIHMNDAFTEMGDDYVIAWASRDELNTDLIYPIPDDQKALLQQYYEVHPDGLVLGDGVHLSTMGKSALAAYLVSVIRSLPDMPAKVH